MDDEEEYNRWARQRMNNKRPFEDSFEDCVAWREKDGPSFTNHNQNNDNNDSSSSDDEVNVANNNNGAPSPSSSSTSSSGSSTVWIGEKGGEGKEEYNQGEEKEEEEEEETQPMIDLNKLSNADPPSAITLTQFTATDLKRWPTVPQMLSNVQWSGALNAILVGVDEMGATKELQASDKQSPKGNKWAELNDYLFMGDRGALVRCGLPTIDKPSDMKKKVFKIWKTAISSKDEIDEAVYNTCLRQLQDYENTKLEEDKVRKEAKEKDERLVQDMRGYQRKSGAYPPGAQGVVGGGRSQHSTNLRTGQPASFNYSRITTSAATATNNNDKDKENTQPPPRSSTPTTPRRSTSIHNQALDDLKTMSHQFSTAARSMGLGGFDANNNNTGTESVNQTDGESVQVKIKKVRERMKALKESAEFYKSQGPTFNAQYNKVMLKYAKSQDKLDHLLKTDSDSDSEA